MPLWTESRLISWENIRAALESLPGDDWVFRGHERTEWELQTTLERTFGPVKRFDEKDLLLQFVRRARGFCPAASFPRTMTTPPGWGSSNTTAVRPVCLMSRSRRMSRSSSLSSRPVNTTDPVGD